MDLQAANKIINDYGEIMAQVSWMYVGMPESVLPYDKTIIKDAIRYMLLYAKSKEDISLLQSGYYELGNYIDDDRSIICYKRIVAIKSQNPNHKWLKTDSEAYQVILQECHAECKRLYDEIQDAVTHFNR